MYSCQNMMHPGLMQKSLFAKREKSVASIRFIMSRAVRNAFRKGSLSHRSVLVHGQGGKLGQNRKGISDARPWGGNPRNRKELNHGSED